jgi:high-affinity Fe2+/Pb2+ permease
MAIDSQKRWLSRSLIALAASAAYLYGYPSTTISFGIVVLFHVAAGIVFSVLLGFTLFRLLGNESLLARFGWILLAVGAILGIVLIKIGSRRGWRHADGWAVARPNTAWGLLRCWS